MPPPASTSLMALAALLVVLALTEEDQGLQRVIVAGIGTLAVGVLLIAAAGLVADAVLAPLKKRIEAREAPTIRDRLVARADASPVRIGRWNPAALVVRSALRAGDVRMTGLAAEMSYYALISLVPIATALGSSLGFLRRLLGDEEVEQIRGSIVEALASVFAEQVARDIMEPLVDGLLDEGRATVAVGALAITLFLASRVFRAVVRALDDAYRVESRRNLAAQFGLSLVFTIGAVVAVLTLTMLMVVGPLVGGGEALAQAFGLDEAFQVAWDVLRWPTAVVLLMGYLTLLYRYAPNVETIWRQCLPGAVLGTLGLLLVSAGFALYVRLFAPNPVDTDSAGDLVVQGAAQMLSLVLAGVLWLWLASIVVVLGGIVNAEIDDERAAA